ncbi:hypothetical protein RZS08_45275, partial [Arthrospira platensis SPKY1]|nr:hypothetical protein [Arthrospira platensis SPKY1]
AIERDRIPVAVGRDDDRGEVDGQILVVLAFARRIVVNLVVQAESVVPVAFDPQGEDDALLAALLLLKAREHGKVTLPEVVIPFLRIPDEGNQQVAFHAIAQRFALGAQALGIEGGQVIG